MNGSGHSIEELMSLKLGFLQLINSFVNPLLSLLLNQDSGRF